MVNPRNAKRYLIVKGLIRDFRQFAIMFIVGTLFFFLIWGICEGIKDTVFPGFNRVPYVEGK